MSSCKVCGGEVKYYGYLLGGYRCRNFCKPANRGKSLRERLAVEKRLDNWARARARQAATEVEIIRDRRQYD
jgi:hypothetical protein